MWIFRCCCWCCCLHVKGVMEINNNKNINGFELNSRMILTVAKFFNYSNISVLSKRYRHHTPLYTFIFIASL